MPCQKPTSWISVSGVMETAMIVSYFYLTHVEILFFSVWKRACVMAALIECEVRDSD